MYQPGRPQETLLQERLVQGTAVACNTLARKCHLYQEARRSSHQVPQPCREIGQGAQQVYNRCTTASWAQQDLEMFAHSKDSSGTQVGPQEKLGQATRCEGIDFPGAYQVVWWEVEVTRGRQVKENWLSRGQRGHIKTSRMTGSSRVSNKHAPMVPVGQSP